MGFQVGQAHVGTRSAHNRAHIGAEVASPGQRIETGSTACCGDLLGERWTTRAGAWAPSEWCVRRLEVDLELDAAETGCVHGRAVGRPHRRRGAIIVLGGCLVIHYTNRSRALSDLVGNQLRLDPVLRVDIIDLAEHCEYLIQAPAGP